MAEEAEQRAGLRMSPPPVIEKPAVHSAQAISALPKEKLRMEAHRYQRGSLMLLKRKSLPDVWIYRYYAEENGRNVYRKTQVGTILDLPKRKDASLPLRRMVFSLRTCCSRGISGQRCGNSE